MNISPNSSDRKCFRQPHFIYKPNKTIIFLLSLFFSINSLYAQDDKELLDFLHSGTVETQNNTVKIPVKIWNDLILLKVSVNGKDATFMWDNGFSVSGIDNSLVQDYKFLPYYGNNEIIATDGNNAKVNAGLVICPEFDLKGIRISNTPFMKLDLRKMTMTRDLKIEGVIGASIINKLNWKFNFDKNYVEISEKPFIISNNDLVLPFSIIETSNSHFMPIAFNGSETNCQVDFGYSGEIHINTVNAKIFFKASATKTIGPYSISLSGLAPIDTIYTIKDNFSWELSGKKLNVMPEIAFSKTTDNVLIGNKIFRDAYNVIINTSGNTIYALSFRKKPAVKATDNAYGYKLYNVDGTFKVMSIDYNSNTINSDIKLLDEVISINGKLPNDFKDNYALKKYQDKLLAKQKKLVLKFKEGKEISLIPMPGIEYEFNNEEELW